MNRLSVRGVIVHEGKVLLVKLKMDTTFWCLPGGGVEPGEDVFSALKRELIEETSIEPEIGDLLFMQQIKTDDGYTLPDLHFHITNPEDYLKHDVQNSSHGEEELADIAWVDVTQVTVRPGFLAERIPILAEKDFDAKPEIYLTNLEP